MDRAGYFLSRRVAPKARIESAGAAIEKPALQESTPAQGSTVWIPRAEAGKTPKPPVAPEFFVWKDDRAHYPSRSDIRTEPERQSVRSRKRPYQVSQAEKPRDPNAPPDLLIVTKQSAALSQLQTAITLWFNYGDSVSICALAYACQDCYAAMAAHVKKHSLYNAWFESQSKAYQREVRGTLAFFKHGLRDLKGRVRFRTRLGEVLIGDSIICHEALFDTKTQLMRFFTARFSIEHPELAIGPLAPMVRANAEVYDFVKRDRIYFLNKALQREQQ